MPGTGNQVIPMGTQDPTSTAESALKAPEDLVITACNNPAWEEEEGGVEHRCVWDTSNSLGLTCHLSPSLLQ